MYSNIPNPSQLGYSLEYKSYFCIHAIYSQLKHDKEASTTSFLKI